MKNWLKKYKLVLIASAVALAVLVVAYVSGGSVENVKERRSVIPSTTAASDTAFDEPVTESVLLKTEKPSESSAEIRATDASTQPASTAVVTEKTVERPSSAFFSAATVPERNNPTQSVTLPVRTTEPSEKTTEKPTESAKEYCTVSISCATVLNNMDLLNPDKTELIPDDGWILKPLRVELTDEQSAFDVLREVCTDRRIHLEYSWTPIYDSVYIEGINNLYEFDCGAESGWMISVNGSFINFGASKYEVHNNDVIEWKYTCDMGYDIGGGYNGEE